ncbi:hypothetical protein HUT06_21495 [Actinomadura sp. NAK00032]|uniref:hypothetical protein n=1 Tax=Actinomadura sp. NAK00032 TaxID=2742128 RepID=UPI00158FE196|nr:hypothetical protein [Actinomadura sp. NAK00032]QKW36287.1 hypothetical protein HUT06_21495 [Actinomadura sp. NAK00032]
MQMLEGYELTEATCVTAATPALAPRSDTVGLRLPYQRMVVGVHLHREFGEDIGWQRRFGHLRGCLGTQRVPYPGGVSSGVVALPLHSARPHVPGKLHQ